MANGFPQAIGCAKAYPGRPVIAMCGDGGLSMLMGDLLTLVQEELPVKLIVFNNGTLGFVEMEMKVEGLLDTYTGLKYPTSPRWRAPAASTGPGLTIPGTSRRPWRSGYARTVRRCSTCG